MRRNIDAGRPGGQGARSDAASLARDGPYLHPWCVFETGHPPTLRGGAPVWRPGSISMAAIANAQVGLAQPGRFFARMSARLKPATRQFLQIPTAAVVPGVRPDRSSAPSGPFSSRHPHIKVSASGLRARRSGPVSRRALGQCRILPIQLDVRADDGRRRLRPASAVACWPPPDRQPTGRPYPVRSAAPAAGWPMSVLLDLRSAQRKCWIGG